MSARSSRPAFSLRVAAVILATSGAGACFGGAEWIACSTVVGNGDDGPTISRFEIVAPTDGSRQEGTITLAFEMGTPEEPAIGVVACAVPGEAREWSAPDPPLVMTPRADSGELAIACALSANGTRALRQVLVDWRAPWTAELVYCRGLSCEAADAGSVPATAILPVRPVYDGARLRSVAVRIDDGATTMIGQPPFQVDLGPLALAPGRHVVAIAARRDDDVATTASVAIDVAP